MLDLYIRELIEIHYHHVSLRNYYKIYIYAMEGTTRRVVTNISLVLPVSRSCYDGWSSSSKAKLQHCKA
jgi:hypothetical protein